MNIEKIGEVQSPRYKIVKYHVGFNRDTGTVWIENGQIEKSSLWKQVGENAETNEDALQIAEKFLKDNEDLVIKGKYVEDDHTPEGYVPISQEQADRMANRMNNN